MVCLGTICGRANPMGRLNETTTNTTSHGCAAPVGRNGQPVPPGNTLRSNAVQAAMFCFPVVLCAMISWFYVLHGRTNSILRSIFTGAVSGLIGTLIWPTGWMIWKFASYAIVNMNHCEMCGLTAMLIGTMIAISMVSSAAITSTLTAVFSKRIIVTSEPLAFVDRTHP